MDTWIRGGLLITPQDSYRAEIGIQDGRIAQVSAAQRGSAGQVLNAEGKWILPGIIDVHTHMELPLETAVSADNFASGTKAAACGGVTTIIDFSLHRHGASLGACLRSRRRAADGNVAVDYGLHAEIIELNEKILDEIPLMVQEGVPSFKLFMAYRRDGRMVDDDALYAVLKRAGEAGALVLVHAENGPLVEHLTDRLVAEGKVDPIYHARSRPNQVEAEAIHRAIAISRFSRGNLYIVHLTTREGLRALEDAHDEGVSVWAETCPQYLLLDENEYMGREGIDFIATPPLRTPQDQKALWGGVARGSISVISTDHCPFSKEQKRQGGGDFLHVPSGLPGVETSLPLMHARGVAAGLLTPNQLVALMSSNPAKIFGLYPEKGCLDVGSDADLVIFDPKAEFTISASNLHMKTDFSPYEGFTGRGVVQMTMLRGTIVAKQGVYCGPPSFGRFLRRRKFEPESNQLWPTR